MSGFSTIFLSQIEKQNDDMANSSGDLPSWIASSSVLSMALSAPIGGILMEKIGRKQAHILPSIPGIIGWLTIYFCNDTTTLLVGRVLTGIYSGLFSPITSAYIGEITAPSIRPAVLGCITLSLNLGALVSHLVGTFYSWRITALWSTIIPVLAGIFTFFSEETPNWLLRRDRAEDARIAFLKIRGESEEAKKELEANLEKHKTGLFRSKPFKESINDVTTKPEIFKPLLIVVLYFISAQFAGINVVTFYAIDIVKMSMGPDFENSHSIMLGMDVIRAVSSVIALILLKKLKRRHLVIGGGLGCMACLLTLSISNFLSGVYPSALVLTYAPLIALLGYVFFISVSLVPLPWCLAGELLPQEIKGLAGSILCMTSFFAFFISIKCAPFLFSALGTGYTYLLYSFFAMFGLVICLLFLPETKNKTLNEISDFYRK